MLIQSVKRFTDKRVDIRKRHEFLLSKEGWYDGVEFPLHPFIEGLKRLHTNSGSKLTFTKWCARNNLLTPKQSAAYGKLTVKEHFRISCRHKDILRMSDTTHFNSCYASKGGNNHQPLRFLADPDLAIVYTVDKAGNFVSRFILKLAINSESAENSKGVVPPYCYVIFPLYGNCNILSILYKLQEDLPIFIGDSCKSESLYEGGPPVFLKSVTTYNNPIIKTACYVDITQHPLDLSKKERNEWISKLLQDTVTTTHVREFSLTQRIGFKLRYGTRKFNPTSYLRYSFQL